MTITFKCMPYGSLPYDNIDLATRMMVKIFEENPFLPQLPNINATDNLYTRTLANIPGIKIKDKVLILKNTTEKIKQDIFNLDYVFNNPTDENIEPYKVEAIFLEKYLQIIKRIQPKETIVNFLGPFSILQHMTTKTKEHLLADKVLRKLIIQAISVKSMWIIKKIKGLSPNTLPIIMLEEPLLYKVAEVKRECEDITNDTIVNMYSKIFQKIKENNGFVGIQSFKKCNWQMPIEAGVDMISFDAYKNPNNLNIIPDVINQFLKDGGYINWGIVPVQNESTVKNLTLDKIQSLFTETVYSLINAGVNAKLIFNNSTVSVQGNLEKLPVISAEKALILSTQLSKRLQFKE